MRKVEKSFGAVESPGSIVIGHGSFLSRSKRAQPQPGSLLRLSDFSHPFAPSSLPNASVLTRGVLRAAFASRGAFLPWLQRRFSAVIHGGFGGRVGRSSVRVRESERESECVV